MSTQRQEDSIQTVKTNKGLWTHQKVWAVSLAVLLTLDLFFIGCHLLRALLNDTSYQGFLLDHRWSLELDRTFPEFFQYTLSGLTSTLLLAIYAIHRALTYLAWMLAFLFILVDDAFSLHEQFTHLFIAQAGSALVLGLEAEVYAASILWGAIGSGLLLLLTLGYKWHTASRAFSRQLGYVLLALFLCGGVLDAVHLLAGEMGVGRPLSFALGTLEDGGEVVIVSVALALTLAHWASIRTTPRSS